MVKAKWHHLEQLLGQLSPKQLVAVENLLEVMVDPVAYSLANASFDEKEINAETAAALEAARASIARGEGIPHEDILREYGLLPQQ